MHGHHGCPVTFAHSMSPTCQLQVEAASAPDSVGVGVGGITTRGSKDLNSGSSNVSSDLESINIEELNAAWCRASADSVPDSCFTFLLSNLTGDFLRDVEVLASS